MNGQDHHPAGRRDRPDRVQPAGEAATPSRWRCGRRWRRRSAPLRRGPGGAHPHPLGAGGKASSRAPTSRSSRASAPARRPWRTTTRGGGGHEEARLRPGSIAFPKPPFRADSTGFCVGGGVALSLCSDLRICGTGSQFRDPGRQLGLGYGFPGPQRPVDVVGLAFAKGVFFTRPPPLRRGGRRARWASSTASFPTARWRRG